MLSGLESADDCMLLLVPPFLLPQLLPDYAALALGEASSVLVSLILLLLALSLLSRSVSFF